MLSQSKQRGWTLVDLLGLVCLLPLILTAMWPAFMTFGKNFVICLLAQALWLLLAVSSAPRVMMEIFRKTWITIPYMVYVAVFPYLTGNSTIGNRYMSHFVMIIGVYMFLYYSMTDRLRVIGTSIAIASPFFFFSIFRTLSAGLEDPRLIRKIKGTSEWFSYMRQGIGGYHFIYPLAIVSVLLCAMGLHTKGIRRYLCFGLTAVLFFTVIASNYFTAVAMCIIGFLCVFLFGIWKRGPVRAIVILTVAIGLFVLWDTVLINYFVGLFDVDGRIYRVLGGETPILQSIVSEFIDDRWPTMLTSLRSFLDRPLFGISSTPLVTDGEYATDFGQHSFVLDTFALFGLGIGLVTVYILLMPILHVKSMKRMLSVSLPILIVGLVLAVFNNLTTSSLVFLTLICPYFIEKLSARLPAAAPQEET